MKKNIVQKRSQRIRRKLKMVNKDRYRLSIYKSSKNLSAQIIDDKNHKTIASASSVEKKIRENKKNDLPINIAQLLFERASEKKITKVYLDRGKYKYHGKIKKFADTLRKNGLVF